MDSKAATDQSYSFHNLSTTLGTRLEIEFFGEQVGAAVVQSPLWDPKGQRIKA
jgi:hypothetical protein